MCLIPIYAPETGKVIMTEKFNWTGYWSLSCLVLTGLLLASKPAAGADNGELQGPFPPGIDLPEDQGRDLLVNACTRCHDLKGLSAYSLYWNRQRWMNMVETMVSNGAPLTRPQMEIVADYLGRYFGPGG